MQPDDCQRRGPIADRFSVSRMIHSLLQKGIFNMPKSILLKDADGNEIASGYGFNCVTSGGFVNIIEEEIVSPANLLIQEGYILSAAKLMFSGIELMGYLWADEGTRSGARFINWCEEYMLLASVTACELWQARNDYLHSHGYRMEEKCQRKKYNPTCSCRRIVFDRDKVPFRFLRIPDDKIIYFPIDWFMEQFQLGVEKCSHILYSKECGARTLNRLQGICWEPMININPGIENEALAYLFRDGDSK